VECLAGQSVVELVLGPGTRRFNLSPLAILLRKHRDVSWGCFYVLEMLIWKSSPLSFPESQRERHAHRHTKDRIDEI